MSFKDVMQTYRERLNGDHSLKERSKEYREERITALLKSWPDLEVADVSKISKSDCLTWAARFGEKASPSAFNNSVGTLKLVLDVAVEAGARYENPAVHIKRKKVRQKILHLPSQTEFLELVAAIRTAVGGWGKKCSDLVEFLAYGGFRKGEAARVVGLHCNFEKGEITVQGDPVTGTKNWEIRRIPMIPDMRCLLERIRNERDEREFLHKPVMLVHECQGAINTACEKLGIMRFTHHDLRHLFATRCIESGVDIPTVSRWLGHKDGGALAMKTYGHLRDQHSSNMAQKVKFTEQRIIGAPCPQPDAKSGAVSTGDPKLRTTIAQAKTKYTYPWWASKNPLEVFWGQLNEEVQIIPLTGFLGCARKAMGRDVFADELSDLVALKEEFLARVGGAVIADLNTKFRRLPRSLTDY